MALSMRLREVGFNSFEEFAEAAGERPSPELTIDRKDNNGHYEKGNLRWATRMQQTHNRECSLRKGA